jgi:hypothetical protein
MRLMLVLCMAASFSCARGNEVPEPQAASAPESSVERAEADGPRPVGFAMRHVRMRAAPDVVLDVEALRGSLIARKPQPPVFDDLTSFYIAVESAQLSLDSQSLTALVNRVFNYEKSPLSDLKVTIREGRIEQRGKLHKGLTMTDADLQLIDADERDPFDFYSDRYNEQLVAGYSRNTRSGALRTVMPDYADLGRLSTGALDSPPLRQPARTVKTGN